MNHQRRACFALSENRTPQAFLLVGSPRIGASDFTDKAGTNAGGVDAHRDVLDDLMRNRLYAPLTNVTRMRNAQVMARPHDHVETGDASNACQSVRIATDPHAGGIDDGSRAGFEEMAQL